jgi:hypothetical protein
LEVIARAEAPSRYWVVDVARQLAQSQLDMSQVMLKAEGEPVKAEEAIARIKRGPLFAQRTARAPVAGHVAAIGPGWVLLATEQARVEVQAFINGSVTRVTPNPGVVIEAAGAVIEAACGFGGEAYGSLKRLVNSPFETLEGEAIDPSSKDTIVLGGSSVTEEALYKAEEMQVRGVIVGSIDASFLSLEPPVKVRVVATEGFGHLPMSAYTFGILSTLGGKDVSIRGSTPNFSPIGVSRGRQTSPIILATTSRASSHVNVQSPVEEREQYQLKIGSRVRIVRGKFLGASGLIDSLPPEPQITEAGIATAGAYIKLAETKAFIPLANLEQVYSTTTFSG